MVKPSECASLVVSALPEEQLQAVAYLLGDEEDKQVYEEIKAALIEMDGPWRGFLCCLCYGLGRNRHLSGVSFVVGWQKIK